MGRLAREHFDDDEYLGPVPAQSKRAVRRVVAGDIETEGLGGRFIMGGLFPEGGAPIQYDTPEAMIAAFLTKRYRGWELIMHNAEYDMHYLLPALVAASDAGFDTSLTVDRNDRIIHAVIRHGGHAWHIRDTFSLMQMPLRDVGKLARLPKMDIGLTQGVLFDGDNLQHRAYLDRDLQVLFYGYKMWQAVLLKEFQIPAGWTAASTAVAAFRRTLAEGERYYRQRPDIEAFARKAYFGAVCWAPSRKVRTGVVKIDVNAMYAYAMSHGVPVGTGAYTDREVEGYPAIYRAIVTPPRPGKVLPFIPARDPFGAMVFPRGTYETWLTSNVIPWAREHGYTVDVVEGYFFALGHPFRLFLQRCERLERAYREEGLHAVIKSLRNGLYGKFGQQETGKEYIIARDPDPYLWTPAHGINNEPVDNLYFRNVERGGGHIQPVWAAWITAAARLYLAQSVDNLGIHHCYYADTDAIIVDQKALDRAIMDNKIHLGTRYGEWKREADYNYFHAFEQKTYIGINAGGEVEARHRGVPVGAVELEDLLKLSRGELQSIVAHYTVQSPAVRTVGGEFASEMTHTITNGGEQE